MLADIKVRRSTIYQYLRNEFIFKFFVSCKCCIKANMIFKCSKIHQRPTVGFKSFGKLLMYSSQSLYAFFIILVFQKVTSLFLNYLVAFVTDKPAAYLITFFRISVIIRISKTILLALTLWKLVNVQIEICIRK